MTVVLLAAGGGFVSWVVTYIVGSSVTGDMFFYGHGVPALGVVVAGFGWLVGAAVGLAIVRSAPPSRWESWTLLVIAALFLLAGGTFRWWSTEIEASPISLHDLRFEALQKAIRLDAVVAAVTCAALAQRRFHRKALVIGALVAVGIAVASLVLFVAGPCSLQKSCPGPR